MLVFWDRCTEDVKQQRSSRSLKQPLLKKESTERSAFPDPSTATQPANQQQWLDSPADLCRVDHFTESKWTSTSSSWTWLRDFSVRSAAPHPASAFRVYLSHPKVRAATNGERAMTDAREDGSLSVHDRQKEEDGEGEVIEMDHNAPLHRYVIFRVDEERAASVFVEIDEAAAALSPPSDSSQCSEAQPPPPPPCDTSQPSCAATHELAVLIERTAAKVDALAAKVDAFISSSTLIARQHNASLKRIERKMKFGWDFVLVDRITAAQAELIKRVFAIKILNLIRDAGDECDHESLAAHAPYAWVESVNVRNPMQVQVFMQYIRDGLAPCLDERGLELVDVHGWDDLLDVPPDNKLMLELSGGADLMVIKSDCPRKAPIDLNEVPMLINVFASGTRRFDTGDGATQRIDDLAVAQLFVTDWMLRGCLVFMLNTDLVTGWCLYWMTPDSHGTKRRRMHDPARAFNILREDIRTWNK